MKNTKVEGKHTDNKEAEACPHYCTFTHESGLLGGLLGSDGLGELVNVKLQSIPIRKDRKENDRRQYYKVNLMRIRGF